MYSSRGFQEWEIGDVEVHVHEGVYHLFHLIIPNHDYIAHAVSRDGITWKRTKNAFFVGDPGAWDDDMLWTMDVNQSDGRFEMFYTGLALKDKGVNQKIGMAVSEDLTHWTKVSQEDTLIESKAPFYEDLSNNPREWLSFRDPYRYDHDGETYLLICARASHGPVSRRGCVGLYKKVGNQFLPEPPLLLPLVYDDIECPCVFELEGKFYLIGSIREDIKVRYWRADDFKGEYLSYHHDVLLPQGNYAARIVKDGDHLLIYNFYFQNRQVNSKRLLPPPKELMVDKKGRLRLKSFYRWETMVTKTYRQFEFSSPKRLFSNNTSKFDSIDGKWIRSSRSGYELFVAQKPSESFIWEGIITMEGMGKCGLVLDMDEDGNGYFISFDFISGYVEIRNWGFNPEDVKNNFIFKNLQANQFKPRKGDYSLHFKLIRYGSYIEFSIDGEIKLTLIDFSNHEKYMGLYTCSAQLSLEQSIIKELPTPKDEYASEESHEVHFH